MISRRTLAGAVAVVLAACIAGCGDDEPSGTEDPTLVRFPEDVATMREALETVGPGDTILVGAGDHMIDTTIVLGSGHTGVTLMGRSEGEMGVSGAGRPTLRFTEANGIRIVVRSDALGITIRGLRLVGDSRDGVRFSGPGGRLVDCAIDSVNVSAVRCTNVETNTIIEGNILREPGRFGVEIVGDARPLVIGNTIIGSNDCGIFHDGGATCERNIIVESTNWGIFCGSLPPPTLSCNVLFDNGSDYYEICIPGDDDLHADPLFCNRQTLALAANSPCAAENAGGCGQIGAVGVGCAVDTLAASSSP